jgi:hypothetical protein
MKNKVYIVTAYRWGDRANHSYNLGVFTKKNKAQQVADSHCLYRGGKYACDVDACDLDQFDNKSNEYTKTVYRAKSVRD